MTLTLYLSFPLLSHKAGELLCESVNREEKEIFNEKKILSNEFVMNVFLFFQLGCLSLQVTLSVGGSVMLLELQPVTTRT